MLRTESWLLRLDTATACSPSGLVQHQTRAAMYELTVQHANMLHVCCTKSMGARTALFLYWAASACHPYCVSPVQYPPDLIQQLMAHEADIATANCVYLDDDNVPTDRRCDEGAWAETPESLDYIKTLAPSVPLFEAYPCECSGFLAPTTVPRLLAPTSAKSVWRARASDSHVTCPTLRCKAHAYFTESSLNHTQAMSLQSCWTAFAVAEAYVGLRRRLGSEQFADNETVPLDAVGAVATLVRSSCICTWPLQETNVVTRALSDVAIGCCSHPALCSMFEVQPRHMQVRFVDWMWMLCRYGQTYTGTACCSHMCYSSTRCAASNVWHVLTAWHATPMLQADACPTACQVNDPRRS